jgi:threonylcarbamoyladenosine tRNA methylthiotransferase MtaB
LNTNPEDEIVRVAFETLGCKLNQAETEQLSRQLQKAGCIIVPPEETANIYILNTCTVTHIADRKSRHLLRKARRQNPDAKIIAIGCYAEQASKKLLEIEGVNLFIGNKDKANLVDILEKSGLLRTTKSIPASFYNNRTRSFIKIQDGCNNFCTYCVVPLVRGREKSLPSDQIIEAINLRASEGFKEVVLTGTEIGKYHYAELEFRGLVERVLKKTEIPRIRLSSLQPSEISLNTLRLWQNPRVCPHFHLSLQSGSDSVLQRMNRFYSIREFKDAVDLIRSYVQNVAITTDVIVGFPGETEREFRESYDFCREMEFSRIHVFSYSARENTRAAIMPDQVTPSLKKVRSEKMLDLSETSRLNFQKSYIDKTQMVLFEQSFEGISYGVTANYIKVYTESRQTLTNRFFSVMLKDNNRDGMRGNLI